MQSIGHGCALQLFFSEVKGQALPPLPASLRMVLFRVVTPPPHLALQALQAFHSETTQSKGQANTLQLAVVTRASQTFPPLVGNLAMLLCLVLIPAPQLLLQTAKGPHCDNRQSTGHALSLQVM